MPDDTAPGVSNRSARGLDALNLLMADVRDGVGPYLSVYLKGAQHWDAGAIGLAMAASSIAAALCQVPAGLLVDASRHTRLLIVAGGLAVGLACLLIVLHPSFVTVIGAQLALGAAAAIIPPAIAMLSLRLVGRHRLDGRISRNESFNHTGNLLAALLAGGLGQTLGYDWVFYLVCGFALASAGAVCLIDPGHSRPKPDSEPVVTPLPLREVLQRRDLRIFLTTVLLFHFGNAAMLPMAGQVLAHTHPDAAALALSACIVAAQCVMVGIAWAVGRASERGIGRRPIFLLALLVLPLRGMLFAMFSNPFAVVAIQLLDGVAAGIFGVMAVLIASDLMRGTGRFSLAQGLTALAVGIGAALSNAVAGYVVQWFGERTGFLFLGGVAALALLHFALLMPETRDDAAPGVPAVSPVRA